MRPGPLDVIRSGLAEVWSSQGRTFVTFEVAARSGSDADRWIQYLDGRLNLRWSLDEAPASALAARGVALPKGVFCSSWRPGDTAVLEVGDLLLDETASLVDALFEKLVADDPKYGVVARIDRDR